MPSSMHTHKYEYAFHHASKRRPTAPTCKTIGVLQTEYCHITTTHSPFGIACPSSLNFIPDVPRLMHNQDPPRTTGNTTDRAHMMFVLCVRLQGRFRVCSVGVAVCTATARHTSQQTPNAIPANITTNIRTRHNTQRKRNKIDFRPPFQSKHTLT